MNTDRESIPKCNCCRASSVAKTYPHVVGVHQIGLRRPSSSTLGLDIHTTNTMRRSALLRNIIRTVGRPGFGSTPCHGRRTLRARGSRLAPQVPALCSTAAARSRMHSTIRELYHGNLEYMAKMSEENPGLLPTLAKEGQRKQPSAFPTRISKHRLLGPPFLLIDCSDSRVNEQAIFSAKPGTLFTAGNIANRFDEWDLNSCVLFSYR